MKKNEDLMNNLVESAKADADRYHYEHFTAKGMFERLGFKQEEDNIFIVYTNKNGDVVRFHKNNHKYFNTLSWVDSEMHDAIGQQIKEMELNAVK